MEEGQGGENRKETFLKKVRTNILLKYFLMIYVLYFVKYWLNIAELQIT